MPVECRKRQKAKRENSKELKTIKQMRDFRHYEGTSWPDMTRMEQVGQKNNDHELFCAYVIYMHKQGRRQLPIM